MSRQSPPGVEVRPATDADRLAVEHVLERGAPGPGVALPATAEMFVAEVAGAVVGVIGLERLESDALLTLSCVDPDWRGRGVGSLLVERALTEAALEAADSVYLLTSESDRFFARFGFTPIEPQALPFVILRAARRVNFARPGATPMRLRIGSG